MNESMDITRTPNHTRLTMLRKVIIAALAGTVVVGAITQLEISRLLPPLAIIMVLTVIVAGLCATRWRWAPLLAVVWSIISLLPGMSFTIANLSRPADLQQFVRTLIGLVLAIVVVTVGIATMLSERRQTGAELPSR